MRHRIQAVVMAVGGLFLANAAQAQCVRHIYNNSNQVWSVQYTPGIGYVQFTDIACDNNTNGPCKIAPHTTATVEFHSNAGGVVITDNKGQSRNWSYSADWKQGNCPYIWHSGRTGAVALNDPANSDLNMWGADDWDSD